MPYEMTVTDLMKRIRKVENQHEMRKRSHELDHSLWRLDEYILEEIRHNARIKRENYPSFTSNAPRTLSRAVMALLNKNAPHLRIELPPDVSDQEQDTINANERLINGAFYENDLVRTRRGDNRLQYEITWYITHRGGAIIRPLVRPGDRATQFPIDVYDPYECAWDDGYSGLLFFVRHYSEHITSVQDRWNFDEYEGAPQCNANGDVEMYDVWYVEKGDTTDEYDEIKVDANATPRIYNCVIAGGKFALEPTEHTEVDHIPLYVIRAGGAPSRMATMPGDNSTDWRSDQWESIYTSIRETIGWINRAATLYSLYLRDGAIGPWVYKGARNKNIAAPKAFTTIRIAPGEDFGPVGMPGMAQEAKEFMSFIQNEWQKAGVSEIVFGNLPISVSGFGVLQLRAAAEVLIQQFVSATETAYENITHELTEQFVTVGGRKTFKVKGFDRRGKVFLTDLKPQDIQRVYVPTVTLKDGLPDDPVAMGNAANLWSQAGAPRQVIFERIFGADDSGAWARQRNREEIEQMPEIKMLTAIQDLLRAGHTESAKFLMQQMGQQAAAVPPGQPGSDQPAIPTQPLPQNSPPEQAGIGERSGDFGGGGRPPQGQ